MCSKFWRYTVVPTKLIETLLLTVLDLLIMLKDTVTRSGWGNICTCTIVRAGI